MVEQFFALVIALVVGAVAGATSAFLGWNKSGEPFDTKKFISGLATGVIAGIVLVIANAAAYTGAVDDTALLVSLITIFIAVIGADTVRTSITGAVRQDSNDTAIIPESK